MEPPANGSRQARLASGKSVCPIGASLCMLVCRSIGPLCGFIYLSISQPLLLLLKAVDQFGLSISWSDHYASRSVDTVDQFALSIVLRVS